MSAKVIVAVLAAGRSSRFGSGKLDAPCAGKALGTWALDAVAAAGLAPGALIVGPDSPAMAKQAVAARWTIVTNRDPGAGIGSSIAAAAAHAQSLEASAMLLLLADMPLVEADHIARIAAQEPPTMPIATAYPSGKPGVPARFPADMFADLAALRDDRGAANLLRARADLQLVTCAPDMLFDVDTPLALKTAEVRLINR